MTVVAFVRASRTFAVRFIIALFASFLALYGALYLADRVAATKLSEATQLHFRQGSLHDSGKDDSPGEPANFLIVGSDTRSFVHTPVDVSHFGSASADPGARSDTLMIAHIDPNSKQALIVSFPRDLIVNVPGGCQSRINATYNGDFRCNSHSQFGGPQLIVDTLKLNFNIDINHYVEVNFAGFRQMVDVLGTVPIYFPAKARDVKTGLYVDGGCQNLTGIESLNYVRSRYYQYWDYQTGTWVQQGLSDLGRIQRQQYFIRTLMQTAINKGARDPFTALDFATKMARSVAIDQHFSESDLKRLIRTFRFTNPGAVQMLTVPTVASRAQSGALDLAPNADQVLSLLRKFAPPPPPPAKLSFKPDQVKVEVRDASGTVPASTSTTGSVPGSDWVTERASSILGRIGFTVAIGPQAPLSHQTVLQFTAQTAGKALVLASHMSGSPKLELVPKITGGADVVMLIGRPGSQLIDPDAPPPTTTTTTVAPPANGGTTTTTEPPNPGTPPPGTPASSIKSQWIGCQ